jgi:hypothetical protein
MPHLDFSEPTSLEKNIETASFALQRVLVCLRDHVAYSDEEGDKTLRAAIFMSSLLEDTKVEIERVIAPLEQGQAFG